MALPGPASARCTRYGLTPMAAPSASLRRPGLSSANTKRAPSDKPRQMTRSGRNSSAAPASRPAIVRARSLRWPGSRARVATATDHSANATPPTQASAVAPMGGMITMALIVPHAAATNRPQR